MKPHLQEDGITTAPCPRCARAAAADDRFCAACGTVLRADCPHCDRAQAAGAAFCTGCGAPLHSGPATPVPQEDRRRISVLFVD